MQWMPILLALTVHQGTEPKLFPAERLTATQRKVLEGARRQLVNPATYDARYVRLKYPGGDVPADRGACSDVIIRALRFVGHDLQRLIFEDSAKFDYPHIDKRDRNIDHRRVRNQVVYFRRHGRRIPHRLNGPWMPGDFITWKLPGGLDHIGVVTDRYGPSGRLMVIHNLGQVAEEDVLGSWTLTGHYRFPR